MIEVYQTRTGEKGTCWEACLAALLERPAEDIPYMGRGMEDFLDNVESFLSKMGLFYFEIDAPDKDEKHILSHAFKAGDVFHFALGLRVVSHGPHACIARNGVVIFDPHPGSTGLWRTDAWGFLGARE